MLQHGLCTDLVRLGQSMPLEQGSTVGQGSSCKRRECPQLGQLGGPRERRAGARNVTSRALGSIAAIYTMSRTFVGSTEGAGPKDHRSSGWKLRRGKGAFRAGRPHFFMA